MLLSAEIIILFDSPMKRQRHLCFWLIFELIYHITAGTGIRKEVGIHHMVDVIAFPEVSILRQQRGLMQLGQRSWSNTRIEREFFSFYVMPQSWAVVLLKFC